MKKRSNYHSDSTSVQISPSPETLQSRTILQPRRRIQSAHTAATGSHCPQTGVWASATGVRRPIFEGEIMPPLSNRTARWTLYKAGLPSRALC